jgi:hypothetical protein
MQQLGLLLYLTTWLDFLLHYLTFSQKGVFQELATFRVIPEGVN